MPVYNEEDIVGQVLEHMRSQRVELVVGDDDSSDESYAICESYLGKGVLEILKADTAMPMRQLMIRLHENASKYKPNWEFICAADEFLESPYRGITLNEAIRLEDVKQYNLIQFNNFEFWPTEKDQSTKNDVRKRIRYYSWNDDMQFRCWKVSPDMPITELHGHLPQFRLGSPLRVSPNKFVLRHYRFRSYEQGLRKVFGERLPRYEREARERGDHHQYDKFRKERSYFVLDTRRLTRYEEDGNWNLMRTFGGPLDFWQPESSNQRLLRMDEELRILRAKLNAA